MHLMMETQMHFMVGGKDALDNEGVDVLDEGLTDAFDDGGTDKLR